MGAKDKISNKAEQLKGKVKQGVGDATGDEELSAEGEADMAKGGLKQAGERVKDAAKNVKDAFKKD
ncbi:CsbD family protein [Sphaerisporangium perillae]|uniref:CsbD family protein n=1 Tax=Sphaerisporangium perillae TaxID=2935860 RepID=UPI00201004A7|nr:CsbD family protein [Sphaerisporangium perillae]